MRSAQSRNPVAAVLPAASSNPRPANESVARDATTPTGPNVRRDPALERTRRLATSPMNAAPNAANAMSKHTPTVERSKERPVKSADGDRTVQSAQVRGSAKSNGGSAQAMRSA